MNRVAYRGERIVLERRGKAMAAIVSVEDLVMIEELEDRFDAEEGAKILRKMRETGEKPISLAEMKRRIGMR